ncbi:MAG: DUF5915 domain-containing protein [Gaiellaceae bacterium]
MGRSDKDELRVKELEFQERPLVRFTYKPNLRTLGPRLGKDLPKVRDALARAEFDSLPNGGVRAAGHDLGPEDILVQRQAEPGWAHGERFSVGIDARLDDDLRREGRVLDLIRQLNELRRQAGLELTDRIVVRLPAEHADLVEQHEDWIKDEVLAVRIELDGATGEPAVEKAP